MKASVQLIGPAEAAMLLEGNQGNRPISKRTVQQYAKEMREGRWQTTGQSFSIFDDGKRIILLNGQHRLLAVIESGMAYPFVVVEEDSPKVFSVLDIGKNRQTNVILKMAGFQNVNVTQAVARIAINYERSYGTKDIWGQDKIAGPEILEWVEKHDDHDFDKAIQSFIQAHQHLPATNSWYGGVAYLVLKRSTSPERWYEFHEGFRTGANLNTDSPILALRTYTVNRSRLIGKFAQSAWDRQASVAVGIKAWNDFLVGKEVRYYKYQRTSLPMPEVR